jgi:hypothetical protein
MPKYPFIIKPLEHMYSSEYSAIHKPPTFSDWPSFNVRVDEKRIVKRWGWDTVYRDAGDNQDIMAMAVFKKYDGTVHHLFLTGTDLCKVETAAGKTWSYQTKTCERGGAVQSIVGATVTLKAATVPDTDDIAAGDKFILDDDRFADVEPNASWMTIQSVTTAGGWHTDITLTSDYAGTTGNFTGAEKKLFVRNIYTVPAGERWSWAIVDDKFCFGNGNTTVQAWTGSGFSANVETAGTYTEKARYLIEYAHRLCLIDVYTTGVRTPWTFRFSKNGDPTNWTDVSAGETEFKDTKEYFYGCGKVGSTIVLLKERSYHVGYRTGQAEDPFQFPTYKPGIGSAARDGVIQIQGTIVWVGHDDFYTMSGDEAVPIGAPIRKKFFELVKQGELPMVWGAYNYLHKEALWFADTSEGQLCFCWNSKTGDWQTYNFSEYITGAGEM